MIAPHFYYRPSLRFRFANQTEANARFLMTSKWIKARAANFAIDTVRFGLEPRVMLSGESHSIFVISAEPMTTKELEDYTATRTTHPRTADASALST